MLRDFYQIMKLKGIISRRFLSVPLGVWLIIVAARFATVGVMAIGRANFPLAPLEGSWMVERGHPFRDYLANFDGAWFIRVAALGYKKLQNGDYDLEAEKKRLRVMDVRGYEEGKRYFGYRHFPLFPYTIRVAQLIFRDWTLSGLIVANFFSFLYLLYLFRLEELEFGERAAWWAVAFATCAPSAHYLIDLYSEGMYLAFFVGSLYHARRRQWGRGILFGVLASAVRAEAIFSSVGLFLILMEQNGGLKATLKDKRLWGIISVPFGLLLPIIVFWKSSGSPIAPYLATVKALGAITVWPWRALADDFRNPNLLTFGVDLPALLAIVLLTILAARRLSRPIAALMFIALAITIFHPHIGVLRVFGEFFWFIMYFGELGARRPILSTILLILFSMSLLVFSILFINGYWVS